MRDEIFFLDFHVSFVVCFLLIYTILHNLVAFILRGLEELVTQRPQWLNKYSIIDYLNFLYTITSSRACR